jgi:hypothetical protein
MFLRSVRASRFERMRALPGDEFISEPIGSLTHAITIRRARREVWPWLVQMGAGSRAGWYSYDRLDNGGRHSAERIVPDLQNLTVGTLFPALPGATEGFHVLQYQPGLSLVLGWVPSPGAPPMVTWAFVLEELDDRTTRLVVRARGARNYMFYGLPPLLGRPFIRFGHLVMQRKQLLGIARRVESQRLITDRGTERAVA